MRHATLLFVAIGACMLLGTNATFKKLKKGKALAFEIPDCPRVNKTVPVNETCVTDCEDVKFDTAMEYFACLQPFYNDTLEYPECDLKLPDKALGDCEAECNPTELPLDEYIACLSKYEKNKGALELENLVDKKVDLIKSAGKLLKKFNFKKPPVPTCSISDIAQKEGKSVIAVKDAYDACLTECDITTLSIVAYYNCTGTYNMGETYIVPPCPEALAEYDSEFYDKCQLECDEKADELTTTEYFNCVKDSSTGDLLKSAKDKLGKIGV